MISRPIVCRRFIGRQEELAYLHDRRREAASSHGALILVGGEAGVGKSRLLSEFVGSLGKTRWRVARAACLEFAQRPYGPILGLLARIAPAAAELAPASSKDEQLDGIIDALARAAARNATVAIVEDLHWADNATMELLTHLSARLETMRMLVVASFRPEGFDPEHAAYAGLAKLARVPRAGRVNLAPLTSDEQQLFIEEALRGVELPDDMRRAVAGVSDGNPFFLEELLKSAVEQRSAHVNDGGTLPATVQATVADRLRPLSFDERRVIGQAAVIGRRFELELLAETVGADAGTVLAVLRRARDLQLIEEQTSSTYRFRHSLTRDAIYQGFLEAQLRPLHRTIALALESRTDDLRFVESLAYHWWAAGDLERAARYNEQAGDAAAALNAHDDAIAFYRRAEAGAGTDVPARARILGKVGDRCVAIAQYDAAGEAFTAAADLFAQSGDAQAEAACRVRVALQRYTLGQERPTAELEAMLDRLDAGQYLARGRVHLGVAWLAASFYHPTLAAQHLAQVDRRAFEAAPDVAVRYHNVRAWVSMLVGDAARFRADHAAWVSAARAASGVGMLAAAHYNGAFCYALFGLHDEARHNIRTALVIAGDEHSPHMAASAHGMSAFCAVLRGDLAGARDALATLRTLPADNEVVRAHAMAWGTLAGCALDDEALIEEWFDRLGGTVAPFFAAICGAGCAEVLVRRGRLADARELLRHGIGSGERQRGNVLTLLAVARYGAEADVAAARAVLALAADAVSEVVELHALSLFDAFSAHRDGRVEDAKREAAAAAAGLRRLGFPLLEAAALELAGEAASALAVFQRCGAVYDVRRLTRAGGPQAVSGLPAAARANGLSAREHEIAALVARGHSNIEIGRTLAVSHKTVEKHLGVIYKKLNFSSRAQLAAHVSSSGREEHDARRMSGDPRL